MLSTSHNLVCHSLSAPHLNSELVSSGFVIVKSLAHFGTLISPIGLRLPARS